MGLCFSEPTVEVDVPGMPRVIYGNVDDKQAVAKFWSPSGRSFDGFFRLLALAKSAMAANCPRFPRLPGS